MMDSNGWSYNPGWTAAICLVFFAGYCWLRLPGKNTEFLLAARHNDTNSIQSLALTRADIDTRRRGDGATPLMLAAGEGNKDAVHSY